MSVTNDATASGSGQKKEKPSKEKKVIPKYYAGTNIRKLPKVPKQLAKDLSNFKGLTLTPEQQETYLTAVILGLIPDKFGLEVGVDQKLKAMAMLTDVQKSRSNEESNKDEEKADDYLTSLREALGLRKIDGVDE